MDERRGDAERRTAATGDGPDDRGYRAALVDWAGCATAGRRAAPWLAAVPDDGTIGQVATLAAAGHVLDFDDTSTPGLAHLSAPTAPVAVVLAAAQGRPLRDALAAYAAGFEAAGQLAADAHPAWYDAGWHPTAVAGTVGAAVVAARLLELTPDATRHAVRAALLGAAGLRSAFGSDGKAWQVGRAAADGLLAARAAAAGARIGPEVEDGPTSFSTVHGGALEGLVAVVTGGTPPRGPLVRTNWLKAYPCCLQTHAGIDAARDLPLRDAQLATGRGTLRVHPVSRQAAPYDDVTTGLAAKFSCPYTVAWTLLHGPPDIAAFTTVDPRVRDLARRVEVVTDPALPANGAVLTWHDAGSGAGSSPGTPQAEVVVEHPRGSPERPLTRPDREAKLRALGAADLIGALDDLDAPTAGLTARLGVTTR